MQRIGLIGMGVIMALLASGAGAGECRAQHDALVAETPDLDALPSDQALLARRTGRRHPDGAGPLGPAAWAVLHPLRPGRA
jgi:hypothetical protein